MRLFVAVDLDESVRAASAALAADLANALDREDAGKDVSWVRAENLHLTLRFIGPVADDDGERIRQVLAPPYQTAAFAAHLAGGGTFPPFRHARVLWLAVTQGKAPMTALAAEVEQRVSALGIVPPEERAFSAHLTLARIRRPDRRTDAAIRGSLARAPLDAGKWQVDHLTLYESKLSPKGSTYLPMLKVRLVDGRN